MKSPIVFSRVRVGVWLALGVVALVSILQANVPVKVSGLGWLRNREMRNTLDQLMGLKAAKTVDANAIEDAAVIVNAALNQDGFQRPTIDIAATLPDGSVRRFRFDPTFEHPIPRPLSVSALEFRVTPGVRWRVAEVRIDGLTVLSPKEGQGYFRTDATLFVVAATNAYSKSQLDRSENALLDELKRRGYAEATVRAEVVAVNEKTGAVTVHVVVNQGPRWKVTDVTIDRRDVKGVKLPDAKPWVGHDWSPAVEESIREAVRLAFYRAGYPDVVVHDTPKPLAARDGVRDTTIAVTVAPGPEVTTGHVRIVGNKVTRTSVLQRRVELAPGAPLNPVELEHARYRISRLGVFESVDLTYVPPEGPVRDPVFELKEGPRYETSLLFGYGTYEQLRAGVEYRQMNILGLGHQSRLRLVQSMKGTRGDYTYTVPELFGETIDGSAKLFGLQRQEIAFLRQEYGATVGLRRAVTALHGEATVGYTFQALRNRKNGLSTDVTDEKQVNSASLDLGLTSDRRDNALRPHRGYHVSTQLELAHPNLGGAAEYQRLQISGAYHTPWGRGRWIHLGFSHGVVTTMGALNDLKLPVNERFYPGGDNSIRGYRNGEAAPRGPDGRFVGAKSYLVANVELEQALTQSWSLVVFGDGLGEAAHLKDYPFRERLYSLGLGIRYNTIIGPIRVEYGRNMNPRPGDPSGTVQIAIGYPF